MSRKNKPFGSLVLTRNVADSVLIGPDVEVQVIGIYRGQVRLRIVAPQAIEIYRKELTEEQSATW